MPNRIHFVVISQTIRDHDERGRRFPHGAVELGRVKSWGRYVMNKSNLREAVIYMNNLLLTRHIGGHVSIQKYVNELPTNDIIRISQYKFGHDNKPFSRYEYAIGNYWKRVAELPPEINNL